MNWEITSILIVYNGLFTSFKDSAMNSHRYRRIQRDAFTEASSIVVKYRISSGQAHLTCGWGLQRPTVYVDYIIIGSVFATEHCLLTTLKPVHPHTGVSHIIRYAIKFWFGNIREIEISWLLEQMNRHISVKMKHIYEHWLVGLEVEEYFVIAMKRPIG